MKHIEFEKLVNNFEGLLTIAEKHEVSLHLRECRECAAQAKKLESFFSYVQTGEIEQISQATTARLLNIFKPRNTVATKAKLFGKRLFANLVFDDWQMALNERFVTNDMRQLLFQVDRFEVDLRLQFTGGKCLLSGQVFPDCVNSATAEIFSEKTSEKVFLNDYCEFVFTEIDEGVYNFRITFNGIKIEIENLSLIA